MNLTHLEIGNLRNIEQAVVEPGEGINLLVGPNASGKTSLLEAIYLMGRGRSFRSSQGRRIIRHGCSSLYVFGRLWDDSAGQEHAIGVSIERGTFKAKLDGQFLKRSSELVTLLPLLFISPNGDRLISGSPRQRRRFVDLGLFHVEHGFISVWQRYNRTLLQRNGALRSGNASMLKTWNPPLVEAATALHQFRLEYIDALNRYANDYFQRLLPGEALELRYQRGWTEDMEFDQALKEGQAGDLSSGFSQRGPHRADLKVLLDGRPAAQILSGGQQKLVACALVLAQASLHKERLGRGSLLLVDDLPAELDPVKRRTFVELLTGLESQTFITATDESLIDLSAAKQHKMFHVEHGCITER